jgi:hypothetical protein
MSAVQNDNESVPGKGSLIMVVIIGAVLIIASICSLSRALNKSTVVPGDASAQPASTAPAPVNFLTPEEIERQHAMQQPPAPAIPVLVAVTPAKQNSDEIILQKAKAKVNQRIVERMRQYINNNPTRDNRELEEQIKRRETRDAQIR